MPIIVRRRMPRLFPVSQSKNLSCCCLITSGNTTGLMHLPAFIYSDRSYTSIDVYFFSCRQQDIKELVFDSLLSLRDRFAIFGFVQTRDVND